MRLIDRWSPVLQESTWRMEVDWKSNLVLRLSSNSRIEGHFPWRAEFHFCQRSNHNHLFTLRLCSAETCQIKLMVQFISYLLCIEAAWSLRFDLGHSERDAQTRKTGEILTLPFSHVTHEHKVAHFRLLPTSRRQPFPATYQRHN